MNQQEQGFRAKTQAATGAPGKILIKTIVYMPACPADGKPPHPL
jgi:hypothetical protein